MLELTINTYTSLLVGDIDQDGHVEFEIYNEIYNDMYNETMHVFLNEDEIKQLIDHLNKQIS